MDEKQQKQAEHWLTEFTALSEKFFDEGDKKLSDYWKGQVMGICKMADLIDSKIDTHYYLNQLP